MNTKGLFSSKIFWLSLVSMGITLFNMISMTKLDEAIQTQLLAIDWTNILQGFLALVTIVVRYFFTSKPLEGV